MYFNQLKTPCYILKCDEFLKNLSDFGKSLEKFFSERWILGYSFKTNSLPYLLNCVKENGYYAEVVSATEYELAKAIGFPLHQIIYNGPIKTKDTFICAIKNKGIVNIDSHRELDWIEELSGAGIEVRVGIRVNFDVEKQLPGHTMMGKLGGRFGFCADNNELSNAVKRLSVLENVKISGLHMHISSKSKSTEVYKILAQKACEIAQRENLSLEYIDIGGGFFGGGDDGQAYGRYIKDIYETLRLFNMETVTLVVEPGASVVATAFDYCTSVMDVKDTTISRFVVTDGSRLDIDPFLRKNTYSYTLHSSSSNRCDKQIVSGYTCMENDRIMDLSGCTELREGDRICYHTVGSYTMCYNNLFIQYLPSVYALIDNEYVEVRQQWGIVEYLHLNYWGNEHEKYSHSECGYTQ